jgi:hypothetical protein
LGGIFFAAIAGRLFLFAGCVRDLWLDLRSLELSLLILHRSKFGDAKGVVSLAFRLCVLDQFKILSNVAIGGMAISAPGGTLNTGDVLTYTCIAYW